MNIKDFKRLSDKRLQVYIKKKIRDSQKIASWPTPQSIISYIETVVFAGWKRIRPYLIYLWYKLFGWQQDDEVVRFAHSAELVHSFALVHDDIIDNGNMRHGVLCLHKYASSLMNSPNKDHLWVAQAILIGDLLYAWAYEVLYDDYTIPSQYLKPAQKYMQAMIEEVITGQMLDVDAMSGIHVDMEKLAEKSHYKSWQYTFTRPLVTGAMLAWADKKVITMLEKLWWLLGKAYQLRDDILDVTIQEGDDTSHYDNKTKFSDIQDGQQTYLTQYIYEHGSYTHRLAISKAMWKRLSAMQIKDLRDIFSVSWAIEYGMQTLQKYIDDARVLLEKIPFINSDYRVHMQDIIKLLQSV